MKCLFGKLLLCLLLILFGSHLSHSAEVVLTPSLSLQEEYDDNITFASKNEISDFISREIPTLGLFLKSSRCLINGQISLKINNYMTKTEFDNIDQNYNANVSYQLTPLCMVSGFFSYKKDDTLEQELEKTGIALSRKTRWVNLLRGNVIYSPAECVNINLSCNKTSYRYEDPKYNDINDNMFSLTFNWQLSKRDTAMLNIIYEKVDFKSADSQNYWATVGLTHAFNPSLNMEISIGKRHTRNKYKTYKYRYVYVPPFLYLFAVPHEEINISRGEIYYIKLTKSFEKGKIEGSYSKSLTSSALGDMTEKEETKLNLKYPFSENLTGTVALSYYKSKTQGKYKSLDWKYYYIHPSFQWRLSDKISLELSYKRSCQKNAVSGMDTNRNNFYVRFIINFAPYETALN